MCPSRRLKSSTRRIRNTKLSVEQHPSPLRLAADSPVETLVIEKIMRGFIGILEPCIPCRNPDAKLDIIFELQAGNRIYHWRKHEVCLLTDVAYTGSGFSHHIYQETNFFQRSLKLSKNGIRCWCWPTSGFWYWFCSRATENGSIPHLTHCLVVTSATVKLVSVPQATSKSVEFTFKKSSASITLWIS